MSISNTHHRRAGHATASILVFMGLGATLRKEVKESRNGHLKELSGVNQTKVEVRKIGKPRAIAVEQRLGREPIMNSRILADLKIGGTAG